MTTAVFPPSPARAAPPARIAATSPGLAKRLLLLGAAALATAAIAPAAVTDLSGTLTQVLDTAVGAGNSARLTANPDTRWTPVPTVS
ncbi:MAG: hypothetical protein NTW21_07890 [Verrucomicrobia bacterium]|nr:hypothetical protein [Verrucomicrobiota bacterium]